MIRSIFIVFSLIFYVNLWAFEANLWGDLQKFPTPSYRIELEENHSAKLYYQSEPLNGKSTEIFAYYCTPAMLTGDKSLDKNLPAVVCVHGGGGKAFKEWVELWAKRGYAAIAMDWRGRGAEKEENGKNQKRLEDGMPEHNSSIKNLENFKDGWCFHAVAAICRAHSLVRSFPEVDKNKTAITGISWGGFLTCITVGIDSRFKAAVPVYGCGFIYQYDTWDSYCDKNLPDLHNIWIKTFDPSNFLPESKVPMLFINGTNDRWYPLPIWSKSLKLVSDRNQKIKVNMNHSHIHGWEAKEIEAFIASKLYPETSKPLSKIYGFKLDKEFAVAKIDSVVPIKSAKIYYTTDSNPLLLERKWEFIEAHFDSKTKEVSVKNVPANVNTCFFYVEDERSLGTSSEPIFR